jgi:hypothetical protein
MELPHQNLPLMKLWEEILTKLNELVDKPIAQNHGVVKIVSTGKLKMQKTVDLVIGHFQKITLI